MHTVAKTWTEEEPTKPAERISGTHLVAVARIERLAERVLGHLSAADEATRDAVVADLETIKQIAAGVCR